MNGGEEENSSDEKKEEALNQRNIPLEAEIKVTSSTSAQKQNTSKRMVNSSNVISINADIDDINYQMSMQKFTLRDSLFLVASVGKLSRQDRFLEVITENFFSIQEYLSTFWTLAQITLADIRFC